jgi:hypothetical protein
MDRHAANHCPAKGNRATQDDAIKAVPVVSLAADDYMLAIAASTCRGLAGLKLQLLRDNVEIGSDRNARAMFLSGDLFEVAGAAGTGYIRRDAANCCSCGVR